VVGTMPMGERMWPSHGGQSGGQKGGSKPPLPEGFISLSTNRDLGSISRVEKGYLDGPLLRGQKSSNRGRYFDGIVEMRGRNPKSGRFFENPGSKPDSGVPFHPDQGSSRGPGGGPRIPLQKPSGETSGFTHRPPLLGYRGSRGGKKGGRHPKSDHFSV